ncbi:MAG: hypothetical protein ACRC6T_08140 [Sarcina sp.]
MLVYPKEVIERLVKLGFETKPFGKLAFPDKPVLNKLKAISNISIKFNDIDGIYKLDGTSVVPNILRIKKGAEKYLPDLLTVDLVKEVQNNLVLIECKNISESLNNLINKNVQEGISITEILSNLLLDNKYGKIPQYLKESNDKIEETLTVFSNKGDIVCNVFIGVYFDINHLEGKYKRESPFIREYVVKAARCSSYGNKIVVVPRLQEVENLLTIKEEETLEDLFDTNTIAKSTMINAVEFKNIENKYPVEVLEVKAPTTGKFIAKSIFKS